MITVISSKTEIIFEAVTFGELLFLEGCYFWHKLAPVKFYRYYWGLLLWELYSILLAHYIL